MDHPPPESMMAAFSDAVYRVFDGETRIELRIGECSAAMAALLARRGATHAGLVTGENPFGQAQAPAENVAANAELAAAIDALGLPRLPSDGGSEDGAWNEPGFLVIGGEGEPVAALARQFRQAAWVRIGADGSVRLAACRYPKAGEGPAPCWPAGVLPGD